MLLQLAWRNIWRNPRRTFVILLAVIVGVWSMIFLGALMRGMMTGMVNNGIATLTGDIQIHQNGYRNDPVIENSITVFDKLKPILDQLLPPESKWCHRIRVNAIVSNARHSSGATLVGIDPLKERDISFIGNAVTEGYYLNAEDERGIVIGQALAEKLETRIGKKLILMSQDMTGDIGSRAFRIVGIFQAEMEATEKQFIFITLSAARRMLKFKKGVSEISIIVPGHKDAHAIAELVAKKLEGYDLDVNTWQEALPLLTAYLELFDSFIVIWYLVVFVAMGFGIVNTTLMAVFERMREFGLLKSLGMKPWRIVKEVLVESLCLLLLGIAAGNILAFLSIILMSKTGLDLSAFAEGAEFAGISRIVYPDAQFSDMAMANLVVLVLGLLVSLYPAVKAARFSPVEALSYT